MNGRLTQTDLLKAPWHHFDTIDSTNAFLMGLAPHERIPGTSCSADVQTRGKGRNDRIWFSPPGGLYLSVLFIPSRPLEDWGSLSLAAGLASKLAIERINGNLSIMFKWPNDLLLHDKKVAGILIQSRHGDSPFAVIGIGINVLTSIDDLPHRLLFPATSLRSEDDMDWSIRELMEAVRFELIKTVFEWETSKKAIMDLWKLSSATIGRTIRINVVGQTLEGVDQGIDEHGNLIVETESGTRTILAGDLLGYQPHEHNSAH